MTSRLFMRGGMSAASFVKRRVYRVAIEPLFVTVPELVDVWFAVTLVVLLSPTIVVLTMLCEPIAVIDEPVPLPASKPSLAALTWAAEAPSRLCMLLESMPPTAPAAPHRRPDVPVELVVPVTGVLCACAAAVKKSNAVRTKAGLNEARNVMAIPLKI